MLTLAANPPKPAGHALIVGAETLRAATRKALVALAYEVDERDDPYAAMLELCRRPLVYRAIVLSLQGLYRDELSIISTVRRRFPHVSIWLTHTDGRQAALAEAMRLGAEALVDDDGIHSFNDAGGIGPQAPLPKPTQFRPAPSQESQPSTSNQRTGPAERADRPDRQGEHRDEHPEPKQSTNGAGEPVLSADELRALLAED
jgi:hypothetical protein